MVSFSVGCKCGFIPVQILSHTKELAEKVKVAVSKGLSLTTSFSMQLGLDVIYGDTDSVMINSHSHSLSEAQAMAQR